MVLGERNVRIGDYIMNYKNKANTGDKIKAFDFQPMEGRDDRYVVGTIINKDDYSYTIQVEKDTNAPEGYRIEVIVPFVVMCDFENRITKV